LTRAVKRAYDSTRRQEQARLTRLEILRVAHDLFVEQGYGRTTIAEVARGAGVSPETIYATYQNKATLLHRVWDVTIGGDDEDVRYHERPEIRALREQPDLAERLRMQGRLFAATARRIAPFLLALQAAAGAEPAAAELIEEVGRQRYEGLGLMAAEAARTGRLAVSEQECRDVTWAMTDGMLWHRLVQERGWTDEQYGDWLGRIWVATLVSPQTGTASRSAAGT
jgi:AcrR family transcriptional regulator